MVAGGGVFVAARALFRYPVGLFCRAADRLDAALQRGGKLLSGRVIIDSLVTLLLLLLLALPVLWGAWALLLRPPFAVLRWLCWDWWRGTATATAPPALGLWARLWWWLRPLLYPPLGVAMGMALFWVMYEELEKACKGGRRRARGGGRRRLCRWTRRRRRRR